MSKSIIGVFILAAGLVPLSVQADAVAELEANYRTTGVEAFSAARGEALWNRVFTDPKSGQKRRCGTCHTSDLTKPGKHARTGKPIKPMAPSINSARLSDVKKLKKWFKRNCKWTVGRECSPQERGDLLAYLKTK